MSKSKSVSFEPAEVVKALLGMGISQRDIDKKENLLRFLDDRGQCRDFCTKLQGELSTRRDDATFMQRYQARAERAIRQFAGMPMHAELDTNKEGYKDMAKSNAKKKEKTKEPKAAKEPKVKKAKLSIVNDGDPKWFGKFSKRGIAFRMAQLLHRVEGEPVPGETKSSKVTGATKKEMLEDLIGSFPEHEQSSLTNNINVEVSSLQTRLGKKIQRTEDDKRGLVYSFKS